MIDSNIYDLSFGYIHWFDFSMYLT